MAIYTKVNDVYKDVHFASSALYLPEYYWVPGFSLQL